MFVRPGLFNHFFVKFSTQKSKQIRRVFSPHLSPAVGPYSPATIVNNTMYISGQLPLNHQGLIQSQQIEKQTHQVMKNIQIILKEVNCSFNDVTKTTILLTDMENFSKVNQVYAQYFQQGKYPARACYAVKELPKGSLIQIEAIAYVTEKNQNGGEKNNRNDC